MEKLIKIGLSDSFLQTVKFFIEPSLIIWFFDHIIPWRACTLDLHLSVNGIYLDLFVFFLRTIGK